MKYSQLTGIVTAVLIIVFCHLPWSIVTERNIVISGMFAEGTSYGRPGLMNIILSVVMIILFSIPKVWAKRTNLFITSICFAWSLRNYLIVTTCYYGECPQKQPALYGFVFFCFMAMLMSFFPKVKIEEG